ncbi:hypothetical protein ACFWY6_15215 [Streptomyces sp. NPDC059037]
MLAAVNALPPAENPPRYADDAAPGALALVGSLLPRTVTFLALEDV